MASSTSKKTSLKSAHRLARTIASDIMLYNREKVLEGLSKDTLFEVLEFEIAEGKELYESRVSAEIRANYNLLERALVDVLIQAQANVPCSMW